MTPAEPIRILLVEDDEIDVRLTRREFQRQKARPHMDVAYNGQECLNFLEDADRLPDLILLDINMPVMDGKETLHALKADERFVHIPVVVLTSSDADRDIIEAYTAHAACYIVKPVDLRKLEEIVHYIEEFWFTIVRLPQRSAGARGRDGLHPS